MLNSYLSFVFQDKIYRLQLQKDIPEKADELQKRKQH